MTYDEQSPLRWPIGRPQTRHQHPAAFRSGSSLVSVDTGRNRLLDELGRLRAANVVITMNRSAREPAGVAVYFDLLVRPSGARKPHCLSCDRWTRNGDNLTAIAKHIEAIRGQLRWGAADVEQMLAGFKELPAQAPWWSVLGFAGPPNHDALRIRFRELAQRWHPDRPTGDPVKMAEISAAYEVGLTALSATSEGRPSP